MSVIYVRPANEELSFTRVARFHIAELRRYVTVHDVAEDVLDHQMWAEGRKALLHPVLYPLLGDKPEDFDKRRKRLERLKSRSIRLGGFDVADTDALSRIAVRTLNALEFVVVPSSSSKRAFEASGVETPTFVLPHGISAEFRRPHGVVVGDAAARIAEMKHEKGLRFVYYQFVHSGFRKGADIVYRAMKRVQNEARNVVLVVKRLKLEDALHAPLRTLRTIEVTGWLPESEHVSLLDVCDVAICPSRGGGFEIPALEAAARGLPTLVTSADDGMTPFVDYEEFLIPVRASRKVRVFENHPIHVGLGWEVDWRDLADAVLDVLRDLDAHRAAAMERAERLREELSWERIGRRLFEILRSVGWA
ncbi:MAG: glycosyltransferase [Candidatus Alkanophagales archaeon]